MFKACLFDVDGVLAIPKEPFSRSYARKYGLDIAKFPDFFKGEFHDALIGKADLRDLIRKHNDTWQWDGDINELLLTWFTAEHVRNEPLLKLTTRIRKTGIPCFLATNQEKHRVKYIEEQMFPGEFDGVFASAHIGTVKPDEKFFKKVISDIQNKYSGIEPADIIFFDDSPEHITGAKACGLDAHLYQTYKPAAKLLSQALDKS